MEDLDSMINDESRACILNELDGFDANTNVVVLATTNHPGYGPTFINTLILR
jgi:ATP-dependent 26S proteasome regulatory subunit